MMRPQFQPEQAQAIAQAFEAVRVDYLFLPLLERFRDEYERVHSPPLRSAADIAAHRPCGK